MKPSVDTTNVYYIQKQLLSRDLREEGFCPLLKGKVSKIKFVRLVSQGVIEL